MRSLLTCCNILKIPSAEQTRLGEGQTSQQVGGGLGAARVWEARADQELQALLLWVPEIPILPSAKASGQQAAAEGRLIVNSVLPACTKADIHAVFVPAGHA